MAAMSWSRNRGLSSRYTTDFEARGSIKVIAVSETEAASQHQDALPSPMVTERSS